MRGVYAVFGRCCAVRCLLWRVLRWCIPVESFHFRVEPDLIWGVYTACGGDYNPKCAASCSTIRFLLRFGGAVEVRIVICLSVRRDGEKILG